jgi:hypothetical protein
MNFNDQTVNWHTDNIPMKDRDTCTLLPAEALIDIYLSTNEPDHPQMLRDEYSQATEIIDAEYKQISLSLDDVIKEYKNLHVEEQHQLKISLQVTSRYHSK